MGTGEGSKYDLADPGVFATPRLLSGDTFSACLRCEQGGVGHILPLHCTWAASWCPTVDRRGT